MWWWMYSQVLTKEYYSLQTSMEKRVSELETALTEKTIKLETYEKLEMELDDVVMQAAEGKAPDAKNVDLWFMQNFNIC